MVEEKVVVGVLSDLFGIQARGGCACAGPYGHALLGVDPETSRAFEQQVLEGRHSVRPGWTRVNFGYFFSEEVFDYIVRAVHFVADLGHRLLSEYDVDPASGTFEARGGRPATLACLRDVRYRDHELRRLPGHAGRARRRERLPHVDPRSVRHQGRRRREVDPRLHLPRRVRSGVPARARGRRVRSDLRLRSHGLGHVCPAPALPTVSTRRARTSDRPCRRPAPHPATAPWR